MEMEKALSVYVKTSALTIHQLVKENAERPYVHKYIGIEPEKVANALRDLGHTVRREKNFFYIYD